MSGPVISIVSGTYRRLARLMAMVASARQSLPTGLTYEIILVTADDDDETRAWAAAQPDIRLIVQEGLRGAIAAFNAGAAAARGDYVLLANDDIEFADGAIVAALVHLETTPACGAVAFADDRHGGGFRVQTMPARTADGDAVRVVYAQVGLFRRPLGEACGWWSLDGGHTYGGDNALSARLWAQGYRVDPVAGAYVRDHVHDDDLRRRNREAEAARPNAYGRAFPDGPRLAPAPRLPNPQRERLRVLYLPIFEPGNPRQRAGKRGLREALARVGLVAEVDYLNTPFDLPALVERFAPHLLLMQVHEAGCLPAALLAEARRRRPSMGVVNWNGDVYPSRLLDADMLALLRHVDLQLTVNAGVLAAYADLGIRAAYWQAAYEPVDLPLPSAPAHAVVFLGSAYSPARRALGAHLRRTVASLGLYGRGWGTLDTTYDFAAGRALYANAAIAIGDNQYPDAPGFVSNRVFETLAAGGALLLQQAVPELERWTGLREGVHYAAWRDLDDLDAQIDRFLSDEPRRRAIAEAGRQFVIARHSFDARVDELAALLHTLALN